MTARRRPGPARRRRVGVTARARVERVRLDLTARARDGAACASRGAAVALGNFDGVHRGHQSVLLAAREAARAIPAPWGAAVFTPHPRRFFQPEAAPFRLMAPQRRAATLAALGVETLYDIPFDAALAGMDAQAFAREVLAGAMGARAVAVGFDYRFGKDRGGDARALAGFGDAFGFDVRIEAQLSVDGAKCSSSAIREALQAGDVARATALLTRPWIVDGVVERGDQRGRLLGFPTANVSLSDYVRPRFGVYAVEVCIEGEDHWRPGVANIGARPTVGGTQERIEAHVFDFDGDLYGRSVAVATRAFLRDERRFDGLDALTAQIAEDAERARAFLAAADAGAEA